MLQEELTQKSVQISVQAAKFTGKLLQSLTKQLLQKINEPRGKQPIKKLMRRGDEKMQSLPLGDEPNFKIFDKVSKKYGLDYSLTRDDSKSPPTWHVFFRTKNAEVMESALKDFVHKSEIAEKIAAQKAKDRPSIIERMKKIKEEIAKRKSSVDVDRVKNKVNEVSR